MKALRFAFRVTCTLILVAAIAQVVFLTPARSSETASAGATSPSVAPSPAPAAVDIEARTRELDEYEHRIREREKEIDRKLKDMERLRAEVSGELEGQRKNSEERVVRLVNVFETMAPKSAAGVLETLDDWLAVDVLKRMDVKRVAKVMNIMDKSRSAKLSEMLTGYYNPKDLVKKNQAHAADRQVASAPTSQSTGQAPQTSKEATSTSSPSQSKKGGK